MDREEEIIKIGKKIQFQINKLKKMNCSIDMRYNTIGIFDNEIDPEITIMYGDPDDIDYVCQIVFDFKTSR